MEKNPQKTHLIGRKPVKEALLRKTPPVEKIFLNKQASGTEIQQIRQLARQSNVPVQFVPEVRLKKMSPDSNHQGVIAVIAAIAFWDFDEMLQEIAPTRDDVVSRQPVLLVLDRIEDPHNFGAILRSALGAGVDGIVVPSKNMAPLNDAAIKTSAGAALQLKIARTPNLPDALYQLKERGYWIAGADQNADMSMHDFDWKRPVAIVLGSENKGLRPGVREQCDTIIAIPMYGPVESLNVSVAAALLVFGAAYAKTIRE